MCGDDEGRIHLRGEETGGDEEVRPDDVGPAGAAHAPSQLEEPRLATRSMVEHGQLDLVSTLAQGALALRDEDPEVRVVWPRVHLGDEQDPHRRQRGARSRSCSPHSSRRTPQISPTVQ